MTFQLYKYIKSSLFIIIYGPEIINLGNEEDKKIDDVESPAEEPAKLDPLAELEEHNSKLKNEYLYLRAEFDNFRKNSIKERSDLIKYGPERLASGLLEVLDIFEKAMSTEINQDNLDSFIEGINLTSKELNSTLERFGVIAVPSLGEVFDPNIHEALGSEVSDTLPPGHITQVFKKPYKFYDKILRHGQVIISKAADSTADESSPEEEKGDDEIIGFE